MGFHHAHGLDCPACPVNEYGDPYDVMGSGRGHFTYLHKSQAGWIDNSVTASEGEYVLGPINDTSRYPQEIRVPLSSGDYLSLELRQPLDYDARLPDQTYSGVILRLVGAFLLSPGKSEDTVLASAIINQATLSKENSIEHPLLQAGSPFVDEANRLKIELLAIDRGGARVRITRPEAGEPTAPPEELAEPNTGP